MEGGRREASVHAPAGHAPGAERARTRTGGLARQRRDRALQRRTADEPPGVEAQRRVTRIPDRYGGVVVVRVVGLHRAAVSDRAIRAELDPPGIEAEALAVAGDR